MLQLGADAHALDPLAHLCLTAEGWLEAVKEVQSLEGPIIAIGGGGYEITTTARMWTLACALLAGVILPNEVPDSYLHKGDIPLLRDGASYGIDLETERNNMQEMNATLTEIKTLFNLSS